MAMYYYARKLQKGAKVSHSCAQSLTSSSSTGRIQVQPRAQQHGPFCQHIPVPIPLIRENHEQENSPNCCHIHAPHCCHSHSHNNLRHLSSPSRHVCCSSLCHHHHHHPQPLQCQHHHQHLHHCQFHATSSPKEASPARQTTLNPNGGIGLHMQSLERLDLNSISSCKGESKHGSGNLLQRPPCCSMLTRSCSNYENVREGELSSFGNGPSSDEGLYDDYQQQPQPQCSKHFDVTVVNVNVDVDRGKCDSRDMINGSLKPQTSSTPLPQLHNLHLQSQTRLGGRQNSTSTSTLTEDQQSQLQEPRSGDDYDLDNEIQEIYYGKRTSKLKANNGFDFGENYLQSDAIRKPAQEMVENPDLCYNKKGELISGTWDALLEKLVFSSKSNSEHYADVSEEDTLYAFLLCSRLHNLPHLTMEAVFKHYSLKDKDVDESTVVNGPQQQGATEDERGAARNQEQEDLAGVPYTKEEVNGSSNGNPSQENQQPLQLLKERLPELVRFVRMWTEVLPQDFRDERLMSYVRILSQTCAVEDPEVHEEVSTFMSSLTSKLRDAEAYENNLRRYKTESSIGEPIAAPSVVTICPNPVSMSEQLTLVELEHFSFIGAQELVAQLVRKERLKDYSRMNGSLPSSRTGTLVKCAASGICQPNDMDILGRPRATCCGLPISAVVSFTGKIETETDARNLDAFIAFFHRLALYVATEICKMSKKKLRCRVIEYWIQVGKECLKIRNFNSLMAILAGLSCRPVTRLKKTWKQVNCADLIELQTAMDPKNNFSAYRTMYKASVWNSLTIPEGESHIYKILVPYFALLLRDVYNLNSLYPSKIKNNGHINFEKYTSMAKLIKEIMSWQTVSCQFVKIPSVFNSVQALPIYTEEEVTSASYGCEEPDGAAEKEHFNRLKRDQSARITPLFSRANSPTHYLI